MTDWRPTSNELERAQTGTHHLRVNAKPQWVDVRRRLETTGIDPHDAVLASWEPEGAHVMCGVIVARDGRLVDFCVTYGFDAAGTPIEKGTGSVTSWKEVPEDKIGRITDGSPNSWAQDRIISRCVFELERERGGSHDTNDE